MNGTIYFVEIYSGPFTEQQAEAKIKESYISFPGRVSYIRTGDRRFQFNIQPPIGDLTATYSWSFPGGGTSDQQSPMWTAPTGSSDPFKNYVPAKVTVTATISSSGAHHGYAETTTFYIAPDASHVSQSPYSHTQVFKNGEDGFSCYRLPVIIRAGNGDLLVFAEGRPTCGGDFQKGMVIVMKRSVDNGMTWGPLQIIAENILPNGEQWAAQNPTAVLDMADPDHQDGKVVVLHTVNEHNIWDNMVGTGVRRFITSWSGDHGHTWNQYQIGLPSGTNDGDITNQVFRPHDPDYTAVYDSTYAANNYASDPAWSFGHPTTGHSIQLKHGNSETNGRLLITGTYSEPTKNAGKDNFNFKNYVFWSDDHGRTWEIGGEVDSTTYNMNEAITVELENGDLLINSRAYEGPSANDRVERVLALASFDDDGKVSFSKPRLEPVLTTRATAVGMARMTTSDQAVFGGESRIAYTGPNDTSSSRRKNMSFWMSKDESKTWDAYGSIPKLLTKGHSGYSDVMALPDARVGIVYEGRLTTGKFDEEGGGFLFLSASLHWLSDGVDQRALIRHDASEAVFDGFSGVDLSGSVGDVNDMAEGSVVVSFKTAEINAAQVLFSGSDSGDADSVWSLAQTADGRFGVYARKDDTDVNVTAFDRDLVTDGLWHRMVVTVGPEGTEIYVDGQHVAHGESTGFFGDVDDLDTMHLGRVVTSGGMARFWNGSIGTLEIFDGVLTVEQAVSATQPAAMPVAAFHVDRNLTDSNAITLSDEPGGDELVENYLPQWVCNELAASWAVGATFTAPDSVTGQGLVFHSRDALSTASLMLGIWDTGDGNRIGLRYDGPVASEWDLAVPYDEYRGKKVSMIAVLGPVNSYLIINGETVHTEPTPVPEGPPVWHPANTTIGTTNTDHTLNTNLKSVAIWKGIVPSTQLAQSLTLAHNITR